MPLTKAEEIAVVLRTEILTGQYRAGERLPSERDLAARFGANRGAIREAIKKLEQLGIIAGTKGGVRVVPIEEATLDVLGHLLDLEARPELITQMLDVLGAMLAFSARAAVAVATEEELQAMHLIIRQLVEITTSLAATQGTTSDKQNRDDRREENQLCWKQLGECFIATNQNLVLRLVGNGLRTQFVDRMMQLGLRPDIDRKADLRQLKKMELAIRRRDPEQLGDAIIRHFQILNAGLLKTIGSIDTDTDTNNTWPAFTTPFTTPGYGISAISPGTEAPSTERSARR